MIARSLSKGYLHSVALGRRHVRDAAALKALAHPLRVSLLAALVTEGPMTASQAAARVDDSPSNCSWHLRKLAEHGFVREARGGTGRNRPWQAVSEGLSWGDDVEAGSLRTRPPSSRRKPSPTCSWSGSCSGSGRRARHATANRPSGASRPA